MRKNVGLLEDSPSGVQVGPRLRTSSSGMPHALVVGLSFIHPRLACRVRRSRSDFPVGSLESCSPRVTFHFCGDFVPIFPYSEKKFLLNSRRLYLGLMLKGSAALVVRSPAEAFSNHCSGSIPFSACSILCIKCMSAWCLLSYQCQQSHLFQPLFVFRLFLSCDYFHCPFLYSLLDFFIRHCPWRPCLGGEFQMRSHILLENDRYACPCSGRSY
jgi:hypothetical protein